MRIRIALWAVLVFPAVVAAQADADRAADLRFLGSLEDPETGAFRPTPEGDPGLRATVSAVRAVKYLGGELANKDKTAAFVLSCLDPATGGFADRPGGTPDVATTAIGAMGAADLGIPKAKFARSMDFLRANVKTFEDVRIGAAAVEAWGVEQCPFDLGPWFAIAKRHLATPPAAPTPDDARDLGSLAAFYCRLGKCDRVGPVLAQALRDGQRPDGGWARAGTDGSDLETTYRVLRALALLKEKPERAAKLRAFVAGCRHPDGGYAVKPGEPASAAGTYFAAIIGHWLQGMGE